MSSYLNQDELAVTDEMRADRENDLLAEFRIRLRRMILPELFMPEGVIATIDMALSIDRRKIVVQVLKEVIVDLEQSMQERHIGGKITRNTECDS